MTTLKTPLTAEEVKEVCVEFESRLNFNGPAYRIFEDKESLTDSYPEMDKNSRFTPCGRFCQNKILSEVPTVEIFAFNNHSKTGLMEVLKHEVLGHYAMRTFSKSEQMVILYKMSKTRQNQEILYVSETGKAVEMRDIWRHIDTHPRYKDLPETVKAEEMLAFMTTFIELDKPLSSKPAFINEISNSTINMLDIKAHLEKVKVEMSAGLRKNIPQPLVVDSWFKKVKVDDAEFSLA